MAIQRIIHTPLRGRVHTGRRHGRVVRLFRAGGCRREPAGRKLGAGLRAGALFRRLFSVCRHSEHGEDFSGPCVEAGFSGGFSLADLLAGRYVRLDGAGDIRLLAGHGYGSHFVDVLVPDADRHGIRFPVFLSDECVADTPGHQKGDDVVRFDAPSEQRGPGPTPPPQRCDKLTNRPLSEKSKLPSLMLGRERLFTARPIHSLEATFFDRYLKQGSDNPLSPEPLVCFGDKDRKKC